MENVPRGSDGRRLFSPEFKRDQVARLVRGEVWQRFSRCSGTRPWSRRSATLGWTRTRSGVRPTRCRP